MRLPGEEAIWEFDYYGEYDMYEGEPIADGYGVAFNKHEILHGLFREGTLIIG